MSADGDIVRAALYFVEAGANQQARGKAIAALARLEAAEARDGERKVILTETFQRENELKAQRDALAEALQKIEAHPSTPGEPCDDFCMHEVRAIARAALAEAGL